MKAMVVGGGGLLEHKHTSIGAVTEEGEGNYMVMINKQMMQVDDGYERSKWMLDHADEDMVQMIGLKWRLW